MATYSNLNSLFKDIANSIRSKTGSTAAIVANNFPTAINAISTGTNTADANAVAGDILSPKTAYVNGSKLTGTIATKTASNLSASGATVTAEAGYYASAVSKAVASGSATTPATTVYTGKVGMSFNASNGVVTASSVSGTASVTPTVSAGYVSAGTAGTITATSNANTYSVGLASINAPSGSKQQSTPTVTLYANGLVSATSAATSGTAYANVATAGYIAAGAKSGTFSLTASAAGTKQLTTKAGGTTTITGNTKIVANQTFTTGDVYATVAAATRSAGTAAVLNNSNGNVRYYVNTTAGYTAANTSAYYLQLNTKAGGTTTVTTTESTLINAGQFAVGAIKAKAAAGAVSGAISVSGPAVGMSVANATGKVTASTATSTGTSKIINVSTAGYLAAGNYNCTWVASSSGNTLQLNTKAGGTTNISGNTKIINAGQFAIGDIYANPSPIGSINRILIEPYRVVLLSDQYPAVNKSTNPSVVFGSGVGYCTITYNYPQTGVTIYTTANRYYQILQNHNWWAVYDDGTKVNLVDIAALGNLVEATTTYSASGLTSANWQFFNGAGSYSDTGKQIYFTQARTSYSVYNESGTTSSVRGAFDYISCNAKTTSNGNISVGISSVKINSITYPISMPWGYIYASSVANPQMLSKRYGSNMVLGAGQSYYRVNAGDTIVGLVNVGVTNNYAINDNYVYPLFLSTNSAAVEHYDSTHTAHKTYVTSITYNGTTWYCGDVIDPGTTTSSTTHYLGYNLTNPYGSSISSATNAIPRAGIGFVPLYDGNTYKIQAIQKAAKRILDYYYYG